MSAFSRSSIAFFACASSRPPTSCREGLGGALSNSASASKEHCMIYDFRGFSSTCVPPIAPSSTVGNLPTPFSRLLALGLSTIAVCGPFQPALADTIKQPNEEVLVLAGMPRLPFVDVGGFLQEASAPLKSRPVEGKSVTPLWTKFSSAELVDYPLDQDSVVAKEVFQNFENFRICIPAFFGQQTLFQLSSANEDDPVPFLDFARVFSPAKGNSVLSYIRTLEAETGWKLRVITKSGSSPSISGKDLKDLWKPDGKTVIVIEDLSSPNILNFNAGADVIGKLSRQFFLELQSRYGNQFYVQQEGEGAALMSTVQAIHECLSRLEGCKSVPGLTNDLYYLTLSTSIVGGCIFGFAARLPPSGRVGASWQWVLLLSPLWLLLFVCFGIFPVVGRTSDLEPILQNALGFAAGAIALYLTPIFGPSPINRR